MKDEALRRSIMIVAKSYATRGDPLGDLVHSMLMSVVDGAEVLDKVFEDTPRRKRRKRLAK